MYIYIYIYIHNVTHAVVYLMPYNRCIPMLHNAAMASRNKKNTEKGHMCHREYKARPLHNAVCAHIYGCGDLGPA